MKQRFEEPQGFHSSNQIQQWLKSELGLDIAYKTVYQVVHYSQKAKLKVPRPQSRKQQEPEHISLEKKLSQALKFLHSGIWVRSAA